jgi:hypothetical protein
MDPLGTGCGSVGTSGAHCDNLCFKVCLFCVKHLIYISTLCGFPALYFTKILISILVYA